MFGRPPITTRDYNVQKMMRAKQRGLEAAWILARGQKKHITEALHDGQWSGQPCFILGGGPSLIGFNFQRLRGRRTIAINRAFEYAPFAEILFSMDSTFYQWVLKYRGGAFFAFPGTRVFLDTLNFPYGAEVHYVRSAGLQGFPNSLKVGIYTANNSGYGALQIAICLGAQPIYLLGFDMNNAAHFHNGYPGKFSAPVNKNFKQGFEALAPALRAKGVRVINLNPKSGLRCFEFGKLEEALDDHNRQPENAGQDTAPAAQPAGSNESLGPF